MKKVSLLSLCAALVSLPVANAASIVIGDDSDQSPAGPTPNLDGARPLVTVDYQANVYINTSGSPETFSLDVFNFYAQGDGDVTPFVALLGGSGGTTVGDYDIISIGDTRVGGGADFSSGGVVSLPYAGSAPLVTVPAGGSLVGGIIQGVSVGNVVPFNVSSGFDTFITNGSIDVVTDITPGPNTWTSLNGGRNYEFTIEANLVPEPSAALLIPAALGVLLIGRRRRR